MGSILRLLAAVLLLTFPAGAAVAAPDGPSLEPHLGGLTLAPGGPEKVTLLWVRATGEVLTDHHFAVTVDYGDVAGFAEVDLALGSLSVASKMQTRSASDASSGPCVSADTTFTCEWDDVLYKPDVMYAVALVVARPTDTAASDDTGTITVTAQIDDAAESTTEATVQVGEGVDLAAGAAEEVEAAPGETVSTTPVVTNTGDVAVEGVVMFLDADSRLLGDTSYNNCSYGDSEVVCTFETATLQPDQSYALTEPITLTPPDDAVNGSQAQAVVQWLTKTEWDDWSDALPPGFLGEKGTGDALELAAVAEGQGAPQSDTEPANDSSTITLTVSGADDGDLAAIGDNYTAKASEVPIAVGVRNLGPGTLHPDLFPNNQVAVEIRLPGNVSAVGVDPRCSDRGDSYVCYATRDMTPGDPDTFTFGLRVEQETGSAGQVQVADLLPSVADVRAAAADNNVAPIVITGRGRGPALPVTGSDAARTGAVGVAFVIVGLLLAVRRRPRRVGAHAVRVTGRGRRRKGAAR